MDDFMMNLIGSAIVTAFTYGFVPVTAALFWGGPISKKKFKVFCIIYTIVVWFVWQMYRESSGNGVSIVPAILWGYVSYLIANRIMNKKYGVLEKRKVESATEQPEAQQNKGQEIQRWYTCPKCGQLVKDGEECDCATVKLALEEEKKKKEEQKRQKRQALKKALPLCAVCAVLLVAVCALSVYSYNLKTELDDLSEWNDMISSRNESQKKEIQELKNEKKELEEKYSNILDDYSNDVDLMHFYYNKIGFIVKGSNRYHNYYCPIFQNADEYWAHNIEYCESIGYSECPDCW